MLARGIEQQMPGAIIRMQGGCPAVVPHFPGNDIQPADLVGTEFTEKQMLAVRREDGAMHMGRLLAGKVGTARAGNQQRVERGDASVGREPIGGKSAAGVVGDGEKGAVRGDVARVFAAFRNTRRL